MDSSKATHETGAAATSSDDGPKRYRVRIEMTQVFTEEIEIEAYTAGQAQVKAEEMIGVEALRDREFQNLQSTDYQVGRVVPDLMSLVVLDTETTGLSRKRDHVVEVAACRIDAASGGVLEEFHRYVNPGMLVPPAAVKVHGLTNSFLADKPRFKDIASDLATFLDGSTLVIHNAPFDSGFLSAEYRSCGVGSFENIPKQIVCSRAMARKLTKPRESVSLDALCDRFGIDRSSRTAAGGVSVHGALIDCRLLAQVYVRLQALKDEQDTRVAALLPFRAGELPSGIEELAKGYLALDRAMKPLREELKRIEGAIKKACRGVPYTGEDVAVRFSAQIRTEWGEICKQYLNGVDLSRYQRPSSRMKVEER